MRRITITTLAAAALLMVPPVAGAAPAKGGPKPSITRVTPMRISVGGLLTLRGSNFKPQRKKNTVIFINSSGRTAFAKPRRASRTKLVVTVPASVARLLKVSSSRQRPTRLRLRVLAGKFSNFTPRRLSPVVTGTGDGDGVPGPGGTPAICNDDADHDNDLLNNDLEIAIGTDPCLADTDKDQLSDGWEYWSAKDLNIKAVPYPGKRPFPNALDPSDGGVAGATFSAYDFDGDGLTTIEEYRAWRYTGSSVDMARLDRGGMSSPPDLQSVLGYSDGTKFSRDDETPANPAWQSGNYPDYGMPMPWTYFTYPSSYDLHGDAAWRDDERDADRDGLANWLESARGPSNNEWWRGYWSQDAIKIKPWKNEVYCGLRPGFFDERPFQSLDLADPDVDGDTLLDGEDDQDNDDWSNVYELYELLRDVDGNGNGSWCGFAPGLIPTVDVGGSDQAINPFNPCAPNRNSRTCNDYVPF
jgi:IPT/TIG domain-containing protein